ncbi:protein kinase [Polaromonas sp. P1(28)-8]|nr:protein kinase [Polaromonas sp. P1(28)-8]
MSLKKLGRYDLIRVLGKGAMGLVYEGRDPNLDRRVAIKTIKVENLSEEEAADYEVRFRTEARSAARLQHPNIVSVYDSDRDGDMAYLVMEFIHGDDLKHHMDQGKLYTLAQTLGIMGDLLSALDYAHRQSVVHRDIKPANLLIQGNGRVKLTDFGVARIQDSSEATRTQGTMVGTLKYMSPEQVQGRPIDARADLFAAGIVLYQLLTGKRPFDADTDFAIIQQIVGHTAAAPSSFNPRLPAAIDAVVARALAKLPSQRFATAREFNAALQAAARDAADPTVVPPASPAVSASSSTWTGTLHPGEALVGLQSGTSTDIPIVTQELELIYWKEIKDSNDAEDIRGFLSKFPVGIYADLARRRLKRLGAPGGEDTDIGLRSDVGKQAMPLSATQLDKTVPEPRRGNGRVAGTLPGAVEGSAQARSAATARSAGPLSMEELAASAPAASAAPAGLMSRRSTWAIAAMVVLAAGIGFKLASGPGARAPDPSAAASTGAVVATTASPEAPLMPATSAQGVPAAAAQPEATGPAEAAPAPGRTRVIDKPRPAQQSQVKTPVVEAAPAPAPAPQPRRDTAAVAPAHPRQFCEGRNAVTLEICIAVQCARPIFANHPVCVERRALEQRQRESEQSLR